MTYSIVARDEGGGALGVAVQSHYFGVGSVVSWARAGAGAVATQSLAEPAYGPRGLELMGAGISAPEALRRLLAEDEDTAVRQVAFVDGHGRVAAHTGPRCIREAGHRVADGVSAQANIMERDTVPDAMVEAFRRAAQGDLAERLLLALEAAEREGGDLRGRQSGALLVVPARPSGPNPEQRLVDLRVDDNSDPLGELRRLLALTRAYDRLNAAETLAGAGELDRAAAEFAAAHAEQPDSAEFAFWHGVALALAGREDEGRELLERVYAQNEGWRELARRLPEAGLLPPDPGLVERLTAVATVSAGEGPAGEPSGPGRFSR